MVKRISCRVIGSVPLIEGSGALRHSSRSNDKHHKRSNTVTANVSDPSNSVVHTGRLDITREFADDGLVGQILDCYA